MSVISTAILTAFNAGTTTLSNTTLTLAKSFTDDDLALNSDVEINWPTSDNRFNNCTVRFHNEAEDFKEDSASWPPKTNGYSEKGFGGIFYQPQSGWDTSTGNAVLVFFSKYGVWSGIGKETTADGSRSFSWKIVPKVTGNYTLQAAADDTGTITINGNTTNLTSSSISTVTVPLTANTIYTVTATANDTGSFQCLAAVLNAPDGIEFWNSRSPAYSDILLTPISNSVYTQLLAEDSGVELETDIFAEGITDYYHALAKAEELVRTSRSAFGISFKYILKDTFLEPGDYIKINSTRLQIVDLYIRVNEVKIEENATCTVSGTRFDWTQLAWNVKDDQFLYPTNLYNYKVDPPYDLVFAASDKTIDGSIGKLTWSGPGSSEVIGYIIYVAFGANAEYNEVGRTTLKEFVFPAYTNNSIKIGVRSVTTNNRKSVIVETGLLTVTQNYTRTLTVASNTLTFIQEAYSTSFITGNIVLTANAGGFAQPQYSWLLDGVAISGQTSATLTISPYLGAQRVYTAKVKDLKDNVELTSSVIVQTLKNTRSTEVSLLAPPTPINPQCTATLSSILVKHDVPTFQLVPGNPGTVYKETILYLKELATGDAIPAFSDSYEFTRFSTSIYSFSAKLNQRYVIWMKWTTRDGVASATPTQTDITTGKIGTNDLGSLIIEAGNINNDAITANKIKDGEISTAKFASTIRPIEIVNSLPTADNIDGRMAYLTTDKKLYRYSTEVISGNTVGWTKSVAGADIVANSITTGQIQAGAIGTDQLAANSITASKLLISGNNNTLNLDPNTEDATAWTGGTFSIVNDSSSPTGRAIAITSTGATTFSARSFPLVANKNYNLKIYAKQVSGASTSYLLVAFYNSVGQLLQGSDYPDLGWPYVATYNYFGLINTTIPSAWTEYNISFGPSEVTKIPPGAVSARVGFLANYQGSGEQRFTSIRLVQKASGELIVDGAITATKLAANSIAVGTAAIENGAITNAMIGDLSADKINAGFLNAARIEAGTITADKLDSNALTITDKTGKILLSTGYSSLLVKTNVIPYRLFDFTASNSSVTPSENGFTYSGLVATPNSAGLLVQSNSTDPTIISPTFSINGATNQIVSIVLKRVSGTGWQGDLYYSTSGHGFSESFKKTVQDSSLLPAFTDKYFTIDFDMSDITDWTSNFITQIRFDLGNTAADSFRIVSICIGSYGTFNNKRLDGSNISTFIADAAIGNAQIGGTLQSDNYSSGISGWSISKDGVLELNQGTFRGALSAASGTFSGNLLAASGTFSGVLQGATGEFGGSLVAGTIDISKLVGVTYTWTTPGTYTVTVPSDYTQMSVTLVGAGGSGGVGGYARGGGGGGLTTGTFTVTPGQVITTIVGRGGSYPSQGVVGPNGENTTVVGYAVAGGGGGGTNLVPGVGGTGTVPGSAGKTGAASAGPTYGGNSGSNWGVGGAPSNYSSTPLSRAGDYGGGGGGTNWSGSAGFQNGGNGYARVSFSNPNGVIIRSEWNALINKLNQQGIQTS